MLQQKLTPHNRWVLLKRAAKVSEHPREPRDELIVDGCQCLLGILRAYKLLGLGLVPSRRFWVFKGEDAQIDPKRDKDAKA